MTDQYDVFSLPPAPIGNFPVNPSLLEVTGNIKAPDLSQPFTPAPFLDFSTIALRAPAGTPTAWIEDYGVYAAAAGAVVLLFALMKK